jgi:hypothetical protein
MIKPTPRDSLSFVTRIAQACAKFLNQMESAFRGTLERIYAAHLENAQMRLAPIKVWNSKDVRPQQ